MISRYQTKEMAKIWAEERKFELWLKIELAVLRARAKQGELPMDQAKRIAKKAKFDLRRIEAIEAEINHDLLAFVQSVQESLDPGDRSEFHRKMTSYDTEEIPTNLRIHDAIKAVVESIEKLGEIILRQARSHKKTLMIGRTHGQQAEPITFAFKLLGWYSFFQRDLRRLAVAREVISVGKISGAVGVYGDLDPEVEKIVCQSLDLETAIHATQILHRDRIAQVMTTLAILAGNIEHIAQDFRLMAQTEICEVREPFGVKQKGSSAMPHKKNTILTERLGGMARVVRGNCLAALEDIATWGERDISQSSVERIILPDTFHLVHYMLEKLTYVLDKMEVFPQNMWRNLELTRGCVYSAKVKDLLLSWGMEPETVYRLVQELSFQAMEPGSNITLEELLVMDEWVPVTNHGKDKKRREELAKCFNPWQGLRHLPEIYARFGIDFETGKEIKQ